MELLQKNLQVVWGGHPGFDEDLHSDLKKIKLHRLQKWNAKHVQLLLCEIVHCSAIWYCLPFQCFRCWMAAVLFAHFPVQRKGKGGLIELPQRNADLTPSEFCLRSYVKDIVCAEGVYCTSRDDTWMELKC